MFWLDKSWYKSQTNHQQARRQLQARVDQPGALHSLIRVPSWHPGQFLARVRAAASIRWLHQQSVSSLLGLFFGVAEGVGRTASSYVPRMFFVRSMSPCVLIVFWETQEESELCDDQTAAVTTCLVSLYQEIWLDFSKNVKKQLWVMSHELFHLGHCNF